MFFADAFNCLLYDGEQTIKPEGLQKPDTAEMTVPYGNNARVPVRKPRDLLRTWNAMMDDNAIQVILGAELQDWVRYGMPVKDGRYDMPGCPRQTAEIKRSSRKEDASEEGEITDDHGVPKIRLTSGELYQACGKTIS